MDLLGDPTVLVSVAFEILSPHEAASLEENKAYEPSSSNFVDHHFPLNHDCCGDTLRKFNIAPV